MESSPQPCSNPVPHGLCPQRWPWACPRGAEPRWPQLLPGEPCWSLWGAAAQQAPHSCLACPVISSVFCKRENLGLPALTVLQLPSPLGMPCRFFISSVVLENHRASLFRIAGQGCSQPKYCRRKQHTQKKDSFLPAPCWEPSVPTFPGLRGGTSSIFAC